MHVHDTRRRDNTGRAGRACVRARVTVHGTTMPREPPRALAKESNVLTLRGGGMIDQGMWMKAFSVFMGLYGVGFPDCTSGHWGSPSQCPNCPQALQVDVAFQASMSAGPFDGAGRAGPWGRSF